MIRLLAALALAALVLHRIAVLHRESEERPLPRHLDPAICHAPWCGTSRTGQPDECDCGTGWVAA